MNLIFAAVLIGQTQTSGGDRAFKLLTDSLRVYGGCSTYQDSGAIYVTDMEAPGAKRRLFRKFTTSFKRTNKILYKHTKFADDRTATDRFVLWSEGAGSFKSWWSLNPTVQEYPTPQSTFTYVVEVCGRGVFVPQLLLLDERADRALDLNKPEFLGEETYAGERCYKLRAGGALRHTFWISAKSMLIRKFTTLPKIDGRKTFVESVYDSATKDKPLADSTFRYKVPAKP